MPDSYFSTEHYPHLFTSACCFLLPFPRGVFETHVVGGPGTQSSSSVLSALSCTLDVVY